MSLLSSRQTIAIETFEEGVALFDSSTNTTHFLRPPLSAAFTLVHNGCSSRTGLFEKLKSTSSDYGLTEEEFRLSLNEVVDNAVANDLLIES